MIPSGEKKVCPKCGTIFFKELNNCSGCQDKPKQRGEKVVRPEISPSKTPPRQGLD